MLWSKGCIALVLFFGREFQTASAASAKKFAFNQAVETPRTYDLEAEAFEFEKNPNFPIKIHLLRVGKFNSTTNVINAAFNATEDLPIDSMMTVKAYQKMGSNKYSMIPVGPAPIRICDIIDEDKQLYPAFRAFTNYPDKCPFVKGDYWVKDFVPRFKNLPDQLPGERWKVDVFITAGKRTFAKFTVYIYLNRNI